ncbi:MAG: response regulator [Candidatus Hodarchaeales archaeon]|jgi:DNA-binding response OmpR family regulator
MIVDDETDLVTLFDEFLSLIGHQVVGKAFDGEEAIKIINNFTSPPDLIILDHRMPKKDGLATAREILNNNSKIKILILSADARIRDEFLALGVTDFIEKPISLNNLKERLERLSNIS